MIDEWYKIPDYPNYRISKNGQIKRVEILKAHNRFPLTKTTILKENILKLYFDSNGYSTCLTNTAGKGVQIIVARLMLTVFVRPPTKGEVARHLDDNKRNQSLDNLAWGTVQENADDAIRNNRYSKYSKGSSHWGSKLNEEQVLEIKTTYIRRDRHFGVQALARKYDVSDHCIWHILKGQTWKHVHAETKSLESSGAASS